MPAPLAHIKVLDLSRILAGPLAAQYLGDLGAEVIKIERPGKGDDTRDWGPPFFVDPRDGDPGISAYFSCANRNKRSVAIDLTDAEGCALVAKLADEADVVIENFKAGGLVKYGLDAASVRARNPRAVYCSITGFGQTGPYAHRAGYDFLTQAMGGLMSVTGEPDTVPGGGPVKVGVAISDQFTGLNALAGIMAALIKRDQTGEGEHIEVSLLESTIAGLVNQAASYLADGTVAGRLGNAHPTVVPYQAFATADGHLILAVGNDTQFARFCEAAGCDALAADPQFRNNSGRVTNRAALIPEISAVMATRTSADWLSSLEAKGVPCGPINTIDAVFNDPHVTARKVRVPLPHENGPTVDVVANPIRMAGHETTAGATPPPRLGQHTADVLQQRLGLSDDAIKALAARGAIDLGRPFDN
ncbi:MAG: CoA transferase [Pseudomonadota bacterium]